MEEQPEAAAPVTPKKHRRAVWVTIVATQLVIALLTVGGVFLVIHNLNGNIREGDEVAHKVDKAGRSGGVAEEGVDEEMNILFMGSDSRIGEGNEIDGENGDGSQRSDTVILLHLTQDRSNAYGVSMPRDTIIDRPDCEVDGKTVEGEDHVRFNTAFEVGGPVCTVQTVEELTGIYIDHFVVLDFRGFKDMVDALDGVEVCIPKDVNDTEHNIFFEAGTQTLTGQQALNYVRERSQLSLTADIGRMKRQQAFIASMIKKAKSAGVYTQPKKLYDFASAVTSSIRVDEDLDTVDALVDLATEFRNVDLTNIKFITAPIMEDPDNPLVTLVFAPEAEELWERIKSDQKLGKDFSEASIQADDEVGTDDEGDDPSGDPTEGTNSDKKADKAEERRQAGLCA